MGMQRGYVRHSAAGARHVSLHFAPLPMPTIPRHLKRDGCSLLPSRLLRLAVTATTSTFLGAILGAVPIVKTSGTLMDFLRILRASPFRECCAAAMLEVTAQTHAWVVRASPSREPFFSIRGVLDGEYSITLGS